MVEYEPAVLSGCWEPFSCWLGLKTQWGCMRSIHLCIRCADSQAACLYPTQHASGQPLLLPVWCVRGSPCAPHSFQGNMCTGILPQLRQGLSGSTVGTGWVWESRAFVSSLLPSPTLSLILTRSCSSNWLLPAFLTLTLNWLHSFYF